MLSIAFKFVAATFLAGLTASALAQQDSTRSSGRWALGQFTPLAGAVPAAVEPMSDWFNRNNGRTLTVMGFDRPNGPMAQREVKDAPVWGTSDMAVITLVVSGSTMQVQHVTYRATGGAPTDYSYGLWWAGAPTVLGWRTNFSITQAQLEALGGAGILARDNTTGNLAWRLIGMPFYGNPVVLNTDVNGNPIWGASTASAPHGAPIVSTDPATTPIDQMNFANVVSAYGCAEFGYPLGSFYCQAGVPIDYQHGLGIASSLGISPARVLVFDRVVYVGPVTAAGNAAGDP